MSKAKSIVYLIQNLQGRRTSKQDYSHLRTAVDSALVSATLDCEVHFVMINAHLFLSGLSSAKEDENPTWPLMKKLCDYNSMLDSKIHCYYTHDASKHHDTKVESICAFVSASTNVELKFKRLNSSRLSTLLCASTCTLSF